MSDAPLSAIISRFKVSCVEDFVGVGWWLKIATYCQTWWSNMADSVDGEHVTLVDIKFILSYNSDSDKSQPLPLNPT